MSLYEITYLKIRVINNSNKNIFKIKKNCQMLQTAPTSPTATASLITAPDPVPFTDILRPDSKILAQFVPKTKDSSIKLPRVDLDFQGTEWLRHRQVEERSCVKNTEEGKE